jgi:hypothetical protein
VVVSVSGLLLSLLAAAILILLRVGTPVADSGGLRSGALAVPAFAASAAVGVAVGAAVHGLTGGHGPGPRAETPLRDPVVPPLPGAFLFLVVALLLFVWPTLIRPGSLGETGPAAILLLVAVPIGLGTVVPAFRPTRRRPRVGRWLAPAGAGPEAGGPVHVVRWILLVLASIWLLLRYSVADAAVEALFGPRSGAETFGTVAFVHVLLLAALAVGGTLRVRRVGGPTPRLLRVTDGSFASGIAVAFAGALCGLFVVGTRRALAHLAAGAVSLLAALLCWWILAAAVARSRKRLGRAGRSG